MIMLDTMWQRDHQIGSVVTSSNQFLFPRSMQPLPLIWSVCLLNDSGLPLTIQRSTVIAQSKDTRPFANRTCMHHDLPPDSLPPKCGRSR
ncbi:hypothetical protein TNCV_3284281 [Trichonephila clavipes]|nr:hypothetical protein TNCV_3284281 [Trichonephila clavipes]